MTLMPRPARKEEPQTNCSDFPNAWDVIEQASLAEMNTLYPEMNGEQFIKMILPSNGVCIRNLIKQCPYSIIYRFASHKNNRTVQTQSYNEFNMAHLLEAHPSVVAFVEQPFILTWVDKYGIHHKHIPDFSVTLINNVKLVIEVKPDSALNQIDIVERTRFFSRYLPTSHAMIYLLFVSSQIEGQELINARIINGYHPIQIDQFEIYKIQEIFQRHGNKSSLKFLDTLALDDIADLSFKVRSLIRKGNIGFNHKKPLTDVADLHWSKS